MVTPHQLVAPLVGLRLVCANKVAPLLVVAAQQHGAEARGRASWANILAERNLAAPSATYESCDFQLWPNSRETGLDLNRIAPWRNAT